MRVRMDAEAIQGRRREVTNKETRLDFIEKHAPRALYHYVHAKEKHPYFCDTIAPVDLDEEDEEGLADYREAADCAGTLRNQPT